MVESARGGQGIVYLLDPPDVVRHKVARAVTDSDTGPDAVRADCRRKPGVTNLLEILAACGGSPAGLTTYGALKRAVTDAVVAVLEPSRRGTPTSPPTRRTSPKVFAAGAERCREVTAPVLDAARGRDRAALSDPRPGRGSLRPKAIGCLVRRALEVSGLGLAEPGLDHLPDGRHGLFRVGPHRRHGDLRTLARTQGHRNERAGRVGPVTRDQVT